VNPRDRRPLAGDAMADPDVGLMLAFQGGDDGAFAELVARHSEALVNYFYFQSRDMDLAEDCAQEAWVRIFRSRHEYNPRARFRTYLFRVARNLWIDVYRSGSRRRQEASLDAEGAPGGGDPLRLLERLPGAAEAPGRDLDRRELAALVAEALAGLPAEMREVYVLGELEGLPYAEVAELLHIPVGTVKSRMFNAVRRLRERLGRLEGFPGPS